MLEIKNVLVSLDLAEQFFCCDLDACLGQCCIEGDAGAPVTPEEVKKIEEVLPEIKDDMIPSGLREVEENGVAYVDEEGDLVTTIVDGRNCAFTCYGEGGKCLCAIEKACREGRISFLKPASCHLYPLRLTEYPDFIAVNYHRWKICRPAEKLGRRLNLRLYQFLEGPLTARFGKEWYAELCEACEAYLREYPNGLRNPGQSGKAVKSDLSDKSDKSDRSDSSDKSDPSDASDLSDITDITDLTESPDIIKKGVGK